jgi:hypothetical protein
MLFFDGFIIFFIAALAAWLLASSFRGKMQVRRPITRSDERARSR